MIPATRHSILTPLGNAISSIGKHLANWTEVYLWVPFVMLSIFLNAETVYFLTGRRPEQNMEWMVDLSSRAMLALYVIVFTSIAKQAWGSYYTIEQKLANPMATAYEDAKTLIVFLGLVYIFMK